MSTTILLHVLAFTFCFGLDYQAVQWAQAVRAKDPATAGHSSAIISAITVFSTILLIQSTEFSISIILGHALGSMYSVGKLK